MKAFSWFWQSALICCFSLSSVQAELLLSEDEIAQTLRHGPWPPTLSADPSNRASGMPEAIALGEKMFFDPVLSRDGTLSCANCHDPAHGFAETKSRAFGKVLLDRNTPSLLNLPTHRWFGWAGDSDSLWAQSLIPILNPDEMDHDIYSLKNAVAQSVWVQEYKAVFGNVDEQDPTDVAVNVSKALAAFQDTLLTGRTSFDRFRDSLATGDRVQSALYPEAAQRGLQIFLGRGNCVFCHSGPAFTNGEFHDAGVPYFVSDTRVDTGRFGGLQALKESPFTLAGDFTDDPEKRGAWAVLQVRPMHSDFGTFRVPGLRGVGRTAPYMHNGSLADLAAVIDHYNSIDLERLHADGEAILQPLSLSAFEKADLLTFLQSLSDGVP